MSNGEKNKSKTSERGGEEKKKGNHLTYAQRSKEDQGNTTEDYVKSLVLIATKQDIHGNII